MSNLRSSQVLEKGNSIQTSVLSDLCIHQIFELQVERSPDAVAVVFEDKQLTYRQLNNQANKIAHHLRALGVGPEVLVGICMERSLEMILGVLAILKAGGAYVPLDPAYPSDRLAFILDDTQTPLLLTQEKLVKSLPDHKAQVVCLDSDWKLVADNSEENPICETTTDNLIYVIYTSGSTGQPKGVMIPHRGICNQLYWRQTAFGLTATDRVLQTISFSFDPSVWQIFWPLCFGAQLILPCPGGHQDSAYLVKMIAQQQITVIALVPSMLRVLIEEKGIENCNIRHISCGGEALPVELIDHFFARFQVDNVLHNVYGPTEASIDATFWTCKRLCDRPIAPIGRPIANTQIYILDSDLQPVPSGEPGELYISGIGLARGYLNRPDLTDEKFIPNPFGSKGDRLYKTGDLARYLPDGNIEFLGRIDRQVKIRGFRIEVEEIEAVLSQHPNVQTAVVVASDDANGNKRLVAYVVPNQDQQVIVSELRSFLKQKLANYMVPSAFVMLDTLPLTPNGKVDRHALPAPNQTRPDPESDFVAPRDSVELQLTQIWSEVLGIQPISVTDNFFDLGGYSLIAIRLLTQIEQRFGKTLPLSTFLQAPTVEQLASVLHQEESPALWESLVPIQTAGEKLPLFCVHGGDGNVIVFHSLSRHLGSDQPVYALQPQGLDGKQPPQTTIEDMALNYIGHIRTVQPEGPYLLAGFSSGGVVAFEMARQLQAQGQEVALLALFDARAPKSPLYFESKKRSLRERVSLHLGNLSTLTPQKQLSYLMAGMKSRFGKMINKFYQQIRSPQPRLARENHSLSIMVVPTADETISPTSSEVIDQKRSAIESTLVKAQKQAVRDYLPQTYSGRVVLFRSAEQPWWVISDRLLGWRELAIGELEDYEIPGYHETIVRTNVGVLAEKLQICLSQVRE